MEKIKELKLNAPNSWDYAPVSGNVPYLLLNIFVGGKVPLNVAGIMQRRINAANDANYKPNETVYGHISNDWMAMSTDAGNPVLYHPDGTVKIVGKSYARDCLDIIPTGKIVNGAIALPEGFYETAEGLQLSKKDVSWYNNKVRGQKDREFTRFNAAHDEVWAFLAQNSARLEEFVGLAFDRVNIGLTNGKGMAVYFAPRSKVPSMRLIYFSGAGSKFYADASTDIDDGMGSLIATDKRTLEALIGAQNSQEAKSQQENAFMRAFPDKF